MKIVLIIITLAMAGGLIYQYINLKNLEKSNKQTKKAKTVYWSTLAVTAVFAIASTFFK